MYAAKYATIALDAAADTTLFPSLSKPLDPPPPPPPEPEPDKSHWWLQGKTLDPTQVAPPPSLEYKTSVVFAPLLARHATSSSSGHGYTTRGG